MPVRPSPTTPLLHRLHRWGGLLAAAFILLYAATGIVMNHRQAFAYFQTASVEHLTVAKADLGAINAFIDHYRQRIGRPDAPEVIRIKDGRTVELLYGSHGQTTYTIDPAAGTMTKEEKHPSQPLFLLNRLHKAAKAKAVWVWLTDALSLVLIGSTLSILFAMRYRRSDLWLLAVGIGLCLAGGLLA